jgi:hypothetical protein
MAWKAKQPRVNPPICWLCDKRLYAGGRAYDLISVEGQETPRPVHRTCRVERDVGVGWLKNSAPDAA